MKGKKKPGRGAFIVVFVIALILAFACEGQAIIYKYVDNKGIECYTDSLQAIPGKYRAKAVIIDGNHEVAPAPASGPQIGVLKGEDTAIAPADVPESFFEKAKKMFAAIAGSKAARTGGVIIASILLFWIVGKAASALGHRIVGLVLRFIITVLVLFYVFGSYFNEAWNAFIEVREEVLGVKKQVEERDEKTRKAVNELFPDPKH
jgi:hypothetical protein